MQNTFTINEEQNQFELQTPGGTVFLEYYRDGKKIFFTHTETPEYLRGQGLAAQLVKQALQYAKDNQLTVVPSCSYVGYYVNEHPEWNAILSEGYQM